MNQSKLACLTIVVLCFVLSNSAFARNSSLPSPVTDSDFYEDSQPNPAKVELGKLLMFDKILSGNMNIACSTCHHGLTDTGDGLSLPVGEGGRGLGVVRDTGYGADEVYERVPRNAPPIFNLGAKEFQVLFHDGRVEVDARQPTGFASPAGNDLPEGLENVLAAQAMFPVTSGTEMAGQAGENPVADAAAVGNLAGPGGVWEQLADRLRAIPEYVALFVDAFDHISSANDITYVDAANAIAAFEAKAWRFDNSPFDRYLRGEKKAMSASAKKGMKLFYGSAGCSTCHSGKFQTDHDFHAIAMPQIGQGKGDGPTGYEDYGRERVTGVTSDRFKFRTPTLRNVSLTGPWGHAGAYDSLEAVIRHHFDSVNSLMNYDRSQVVLPYRQDLQAHDYYVLDSPALMNDIASANELRRVSLKNKKMKQLLDFINVLTDPSAIDIRHDVPRKVPSGLSLSN